jgi:hypothetical protein
MSKMIGDFRPPVKWLAVVAANGSVRFITVSGSWKPREGIFLPKKILDELDWTSQNRVLLVCTDSENFLLNVLEKLQREEAEEAISSLEEIIARCLKMRTKKFKAKRKK